MRRHARSSSPRSPLSSPALSATGLPAAPAASSPPSERVPVRVPGERRKERTPCSVRQLCWRSRRCCCCLSSNSWRMRAAPAYSSSPHTLVTLSALYFLSQHGVPSSTCRWLPDVTSRGRYTSPAYCLGQQVTAREAKGRGLDFGHVTAYVRSAILVEAEEE